MKSRRGAYHMEEPWRSGENHDAPYQRHHQPGISGQACRSELKPYRMGHSWDAAMQPDAGPVPRDMPLSRVTHGDSRSLTEQPPLPLTCAAAGPPRAATVDADPSVHCELALHMISI